MGCFLSSRLEEHRKKHGVSQKMYTLFTFFGIKKTFSQYSCFFIHRTYGAETATVRGTNTVPYRLETRRYGKNELGRDDTMRY